MKKQIHAISLLLSFLIVLSHQVIPHHHHDTIAYNFLHSHVDTEKHKHEHNGDHHNHDSQEKSDDKKDSYTKHKHPFSHHEHVSATDEFDFIRTNIQETNSNIPIKNIIVSLFLLHKQHFEPPKLTKCSFEDPPFLITSLFEPGAIALRGPPSIA